MELSILNWIQTYLRSDVLDTVMPLISRLADHGEVWILLALVLLAVKGQRLYGGAVAFGLTLDLIACNMILKPLVGRLRPFLLNPDVVLLITPPGDASFPSGHTAASFAAVFALKTAGSPLWKPALVLAVLIAFSRLYLYVHWPSDVLGGAVLGAVVGWTGAKLVMLLSQWMTARR